MHKSVPQCKTSATQPTVVYAPTSPPLPPPPPTFFFVPSHPSRLLFSVPLPLPGCLGLPAQLPSLSTVKAKEGLDTSGWQACGKACCWRPEHVREANGRRSLRGESRPMKPFLRTLLVWRRREEQRKGAVVGVGVGCGVGLGGRKQSLRRMDNVVGLRGRASMCDGLIVTFSLILIFMRTMDSVRISRCGSV